MMERQQLRDRSINYVQVFIITESGCDIEEGEYTLNLGSVIGGLDINAIGGVDDISLIKDCIENNISSFLLPEEGTSEIILKESGEWEDVFWHKYYVVERICIFKS